MSEKDYIKAQNLTRIRIAWQEVNLPTKIIIVKDQEK